MSNTRVAPERRAGKLLDDSKDVHSIRVQAYRMWNHPNGVEDLLDHLKCTSSRLKYSDEEGLWTTWSTISIVSHVTPCSRRFRKLTLREGVFPFVGSSPRVDYDQVVEAQDEEDEGEHVLEENEASFDALEIEYQEAVAMITLAKQRRAEVNRARQFSRKPQSSGESKVQLDNLDQEFPFAQEGQLGHWKYDNDCPAKVKVVNWRKPKSFQFLQSLATSVSRAILLWKFWLRGHVRRSFQGPTAVSSRASCRRAPT